MEQARETIVTAVDLEKFAPPDCYEEPSGKLEQLIAQLWMETFQLRQVGRDTDFFELGGNSLIAMELVEKMSQCVDVELSPVTLFLNPTPRQLAQYIFASHYFDDDEGGGTG